MTDTEIKSFRFTHSQSLGVPAATSKLGKWPLHDPSSKNLESLRGFSSLDDFGLRCGNIAEFHIDPSDPFELARVMRDFC
jgi:hypothetical protein